MKSILPIVLLWTMSLVFVCGCQESAKEPGNKTSVGVPPDNTGTDKPGTQSQGAETTQVELVQPKAGRPRIEFEKLAHNFGEVGPGTRHNCEFGFENIGDAVLNILDIETPCGCTVPKLDKKQYKPGESGVLGVTYHAQTQPGNVNKSVTIVTNDRETPRVPLAIKARVVKKVDVRPARLKFSLETDEPVVHEITLESLDGKPFSIKSMRSTADCIVADFDPSAKATRFVLEAKVDAGKLKSDLSGNLSIALTHPECPSVFVYFDVMPKYTVIPQTIVVVGAKPAEVIRRKMSVLSNYKKPFEIDKVISPDGTVKMLSKEAIRDGHQLVIEIAPPDSQRQVSYKSGSFSIRLSDGVILPITYRIIYTDSGSRGS